MIIGITWWHLKKIHYSILEYLNNKVGLHAHASCPLKSVVISTLLKIGMVKLLKNFHIALIVKKQIFQTKILNGINFFLIIIYIYIY